MEIEKLDSETNNDVHFSKKNVIVSYLIKLIKVK